MYFTFEDFLSCVKLANDAKSVSSRDLDWLSMKLYSAYKHCFFDNYSELEELCDGAVFGFLMAQGDDLAGIENTGVPLDVSRLDSVMGTINLDSEDPLGNGWSYGGSH